MDRYIVTAEREATGTQTARATVHVPEGTAEQIVFEITNTASDTDSGRVREGLTTTTSYTIRVREAATGQQTAEVTVEVPVGETKTVGIVVKNPSQSPLDANITYGEGGYGDSGFGGVVG